MLLDMDRKDRLEHRQPVGIEHKLGGHKEKCHVGSPDISRC